MRLSDQRLVFIKRVRTQSSELKIARFLSAPETLEDPNNHCVTLIDSFPDDNEPWISFMVMQFLRNFDDPPFHAVEEALDFMKQVLEVNHALFTVKIMYLRDQQGLSYIHAKNVAHRYVTSIHPSVLADTPVEIFLWVIL